MQLRRSLGAYTVLAAQAVLSDGITIPAALTFFQTEALRLSALHPT
jgi:hypothetical protein